MNIIDYVILVFLVFYFWRGWSKGLLKSLLKPIVLIGCIGYAYFYFLRTQNFILSLGIAILGPIVFNVVFTLLVALLKKADKKEDDQRVALEAWDRFLGGVFSVCWGMFWVLMPLVSVAAIPFKIPGFEPVRQAIVASKTIAAIDTATGSKLPLVGKNAQLIDLRHDQEYLQRLRESPEYQQLIKDPRVEELAANDGIKEMIDNGDIAGLLQSPQMKEVLNDPKLIQQFLKLNQQLTQMK